MCKYMAEPREAKNTGCEPSEVRKNEAMIAEAEHSEGDLTPPKKLLTIWQSIYHRKF